MIRTIISLTEEEKAWLDRTARERGVPMTQLVREAVDLLRHKLSEPEPRFIELLEATSGTWTQGDGLQYQEALRDEW